MAAKYLPPNKNASIVDIGAGNGLFVDYLHLASKYENLSLLDGNNITVESLNKRFKNAILYKAPERLPFESHTVDYIHCSHLIEHLYYHELHQFLKEIDRTLKDNGIFIVSTPLLWDIFYNDLSHVRPYNPSVFLHYLSNISDNSSSPRISENYSALELVYRYEHFTRFSEGWGSAIMNVDFAIQLFKKILLKLKIHKYKKTGYTLVLKKNK